jgi:glycosyltransferase involved in cell wall biosynthesis
MTETARSRRTIADSTRDPAAAESTRKLITISIPVYNEQGNIAHLLARLDKLAANNPTYDFEFLFTDNASEDTTYALLKDAALNDRRIRVLRMSRNFGFQRSILTNFMNARGDAAVQVDADLQDPPELITEFLKYWERGYQVVYGIRRKREESRLLAWSRKLYYRLIDHLSDVPVPHDAGDFRLIDRKIINHLGDIRERSPYLRGYIAGLGYRQIGVSYDRTARQAGVSKFRLPALIRLGIDGICSQSTKPLNYVLTLGFGICILTVLVTLFYLMRYLFGGSDLPAGFTTLTLLMLFSIGLNALFIGLIGEYVGRIYDTTRQHSMAIIESSIEDGVERK